MKKKSTLLRAWKSNFTTYGIVILFYLVMELMRSTGSLSRLMRGQLIPICAYVIMAVSLNLTVGVLGELSLGHAGFVSVGCFTGALGAGLVRDAGGSPLVSMIAAVLIGAVAAMLFGFLVGIPVLRLNGDYLAIVTLASCQIIKSLLTNVYVSKDAAGLHFSFMEKAEGMTTENMIIRGPQGLKTPVPTEDFTFAIILVLICLVIIYNLIGSKTGRTIMALRDNKIAARSVGVNITSYKLMTFVISAAMAGAAGALFGQSQSALLPGKFDFNTSILVLVFVVLGGLGNIRGSIFAAAILTILPEKLRFLRDYRMIIYAVVLIVVMLVRNSRVFQNLGDSLKKFFRERFGKKKAHPAAGPAEKPGKGGGENG